MSANEKINRDAGAIKDESARNEEASEEKAAPESRRPSRLKEVQPRELCQMENFREVTLTIHDAIEAHRRLWEDAKTLHGDVNNNTIIILDWPEGSDHKGPRNHGALVDFDIPYTIQAVRKLRQRWPPKMEIPRWYH
ncbi:hypothetical protein C8Q74DRAFT_1368001 [Fomes fomentarius]|nr:hypothetical protein C8Q74DRAFT_1368001 [Fomes fomentarius]